MNASRTARPQQSAPQQVVVPGTSARMPGLNKPQPPRQTPVAGASGDRRQLSLW